MIVPPILIYGPVQRHYTVCTSISKKSLNARKRYYSKVMDIVVVSIDFRCDMELSNE